MCACVPELQKSRRLPASDRAIGWTVLLAVLFRRRFVVAHALLSVVVVVVVSVVVTLQTVRAVVLGARRRIWILHDSEFGAGQIITTSARVLAILRLSMAAPRIVEAHRLRELLRFRRRSGSRGELVFAGD